MFRLLQTKDDQGTQNKTGGKLALGNKTFGERTAWFQDLHKVWSKLLLQ